MLCGGALPHGTHVGCCFLNKARRNSNRRKLNLVPRRFQWNWPAGSGEVTGQYDNTGRNLSSTVGAGRELASRTEYEMKNNTFVICVEETPKLWESRRCVGW